MHVYIEIKDQDNVLFQEICIKAKAFSAASVNVSFRMAVHYSFIQIETLGHSFYL